MGDPYYSYPVIFTENVEKFYGEQWEILRKLA